MVSDWQVNVVKGLKLYENMFTDSELTKLIDFANELRAAGQNGELSGDLVSQILKLVSCDNLLLCY